MIKYKIKSNTLSMIYNMSETYGFIILKLSEKQKYLKI